MTRAILAAGIFSVLSPPQTPVVYHVTLREISPTTARLVDAALEAARRGSGVVLLDLTSPSGDGETSMRIAAAIADSPVAVYALVSGPAWEGAAVVALAADSVFVTAEASIGANPSRSPSPGESLSTPTREMVAAGSLPALALAMFDPTLEVSGAPVGIRLTLTGSDAVAAGVAVGPVVGLDDALRRVGLSGTEPVQVDEPWLGTTVRVANRNSRDVRIFVRRGGRSRLGNVTSLNDAEFHIPGQMLVEGSVIVLTAEVIGSTDRVTTERIRVEPGLLIEWVIEEAIRQSNYFVSRRY